MTFVQCRSDISPPVLKAIPCCADSQGGNKSANPRSSIQCPFQALPRHSQPSMRFETLDDGCARIRAPETGSHVSNDDMGHQIGTKGFVIVRCTMSAWLKISGPKGGRLQPPRSSPSQQPSLRKPKRVGLRLSFSPDLQSRSILAISFLRLAPNRSLT